MIRRHSTTDLEHRVKTFTAKHGDDDYPRLARLIVHFKYNTAVPSLQNQLAESMSNRRQKLRYTRRHQDKLANRKTSATKPGPRAVEERQVNQASTTTTFKSVPERNPNDILSPISDQQRMDSIPKSLYTKSLARSHTNASGFKPTPSAKFRMQKADRMSAISSSQNSTTFTIEGLEDFPDPPQREPGGPDPLCDFCRQPLNESDTKPERW